MDLYYEKNKIVPGSTFSVPSLKTRNIVELKIKKDAGFFTRLFVMAL
jgi:hypothetical protein